MKKENQLPAEIKNQVKNSGMKLSIAETIASFYATFMQQAQEQSLLLKVLSKDNAEDVEKAKRIRLDLGKICSAVMQRKKDDKELLLVKSRYIDGLFNTVEGFARLTQKDAEKIEKHAENLKKAELDLLEDKRNNKLNEFEIDFTTVDTRNMSKEVWQIYLKGVHDQYTQRKIAESEAETRRIQEEKSKKIFNDRQKTILVFDAFNVEFTLTEETTEEEFALILKSCEEAREFAINQQKEREKENERLKKEAEARIEAEKKASDERMKKEDVDRKEREKASAEAKKRANEQQAEIKRLNKIEEDRQIEAKKKLEKDKEELRKLKKAPDVEKLKQSIDDLYLPIQEMTDDKVIIVSMNIQDRFEGFKAWAKEQIQNCK